MATETKLRQLADKGCPVYYFYSSERYLVRHFLAPGVWWCCRRSTLQLTVTRIWKS